MHTAQLPNLRSLTHADIEKELREFEAKERARLGLDSKPVEHWRDTNPQDFVKADRSSTTLLCGGLTRAQDMLIGAALRGVGYRVQPLEVPDNDALRIGKEFGNRGQCNPTYFTVGNLVKHLIHLRDEQGMSTEQIIRSHVFVTAGACGPCRFGTYATEYRKALRDAGFDGFRVLLFQQKGGLKQATGENNGLEFNPKFFFALIKAVMAGDVLNAIGYRIRPYEIEPGSTNRVLEDCKRTLAEALQHRRNIPLALWRCRRLLKSIPVNRLQAKPKVSIIGEFWAMTTEGDGNYKLQQFLESEGAEVDVQVVTAWLLYMLWQGMWDTKQRMTLPQDDEANGGLDGKNPRRKLLTLWSADKAMRGLFGFYARLIGLRHYKLPDMDEIATISHQHYDVALRGGEGHMEVGKLIQSVTHKKAHMVISVKPFGCMPSSGVSDGVQSLITTKYPAAIFSAIETTGDGAANVKSRIQMDLFKAKQVAQVEFEAAKATSRGNAEKHNHALVYPHTHGFAGTAARLVAQP
ncbi:MAG: 2-hydroxyglutaryl-CoA dehydratase [Verrucomicrobiaceae bacterium]|nr:2-hydroxyglutaryl-CoA dehydratase [Verrucomicrobiaceae bacterium]